MSKPWLLVSPASRGIGLQLARRLLSTTDLPVIATARRDLKGTNMQILDGLDVDKQRLEVLKLDVTGTLSTHPMQPQSLQTQFRRINYLRCSILLLLTLLRRLPPSGFLHSWRFTP